MTKDKIGILGLGNLLLGDEGFGVHCIQRLEEAYELPGDIEVLDGGTAGIMLAPYIEKLDLLFVLDTVALDEPPGTIRCFTDADVRAGNIQMRMSPHQVGLLDIIDICRLRGQVPRQIIMLTVVPEDLSTRIGLSATLLMRVDEVITLLGEKLAGHGIVLTPKNAAPHA